MGNKIRSSLITDYQSCCVILNIPPIKSEHKYAEDHWARLHKLLALSSEPDRIFFWLSSKCNSSAYLVCSGIYVIGFSYPVVPVGRARIRVQISAAHSMEDIDRAVDAFIKVGKSHGVIWSFNEILPSYLRIDCLFVHNIDCLYIIARYFEDGLHFPYICSLQLRSLYVVWRTTAHFHPFSCLGINVESLFD